LKKIFFIGSIISGVVGADAQLRPLPISQTSPTQEQQDSDRINHECKYLNKYSIEQRNAFYPFNIAKKVKLISFNEKRDKNELTVTNGRLPMKGKRLIYTDIMELKTLNKSQIDSLTDILYNNIYTGYFFTIVSPECYKPKNAILFLGDKGGLIGFIEICFECYGYRASSKKIVVGDFCSQKYDLLKLFFQHAGIEFGVTNNLDNNE